MKKIFPIFCLVLLCSVPLGAQVLEQTFDDSDAFFKISTPNEHWSFEPRGIDPGQVRLTIRYDSAVDQFVPNVTVRVQTVDSPKVKLEALLRRELNLLPEGVDLVEKKKITHGNLDGFEVVMHDKQSKVVFHQWIFIAKGRSYVITCSSNKETYTRMRPDFLKILESFAITSAET